MVAFALYLLTGLATGIQVLVLVAFAVWGRPVSPLEVISLFGSSALVVIAIWALFRPYRAAVGALVTAFVMSFYYGYALYTATANIFVRGSNYPVRLFVPPALLLATLVYSGLTVGRFKSADTIPTIRNRWAAVPLGILLAALAPRISLADRVLTDFRVPRRVVTLPMAWRRGDSYYGRNFINLESPCINNQDPHCYCALEFKVINSPAFADHIESFGERPVPVRFAVLYSHDGKALSASLLSVDDWPSEKFYVNDTLLGVGFRAPERQEIKPGEKVLHSNNPADCFVSLTGSSL